MVPILGGLGQEGFILSRGYGTEIHTVTVLGWAVLSPMVTGVILSADSTGD